MRRVYTSLLNDTAGLPVSPRARTFATRPASRVSEKARMGMMSKSDDANGVELTGDARVECRPAALFYCGTGYALFFAIAFCLLQFAPDNHGALPPPSSRVALMGVSALLVGIALFISCLPLRARVIANENGLHWRGAWSGWHNVGWEAVTDFYLARQCYSIADVTELSPVIVTNSGTIKIPQPSMNVDGLRRIVKSRATAARVGEWQRLDTRRVDPFPRTFRYWHSDIWRNIALFFTVSIALFAWWLPISIQFTRELAAQIGWHEVRTLIGAFVAAYAIGLGLVAFVLYRYTALYARRGEVFTVTPETLRYENTRNGIVFDVGWNEISDYFYQSKNGGITDGYTLVLRGASERQITWSVALRDSALLLAIVQQYAPRPANAPKEGRAWRRKDAHEATGGSDPATWRGGAVGMGGRIFSYRNLSNVFSLGTMTAYAGISSFLSIAECLKPASQGKWFLLTLSLVICLPTLYGWVCCAVSRVETDDMGITQHTPFGKKHLHWFAVADYAGKKKSGSITITGKNGARMRFYSLLNGFEDLRGEIERMAPVPKTGWRG